jgi:hypothetical protein
VKARGLGMVLSTLLAAARGSKPTAGSKKSS